MVFHSKHLSLPCSMLSVPHIPPQTHPPTNTHTHNHPTTPHPHPHTHTHTHIYSDAMRTSEPGLSGICRSLSCDIIFAHPAPDFLCVGILRSRGLLENARHTHTHVCV